MKLHIKNGRLIDPHQGIDSHQDVFIVAGKIAHIGEPGSLPDGFVAQKTMDATGKIVMPGLVDVSARLREPGYEYKATLASEMRAAVAGGVTSLVCPPDTDPVLDEPGLVEMLTHRAKSARMAHVYPLGALTVGLKGCALTEMAELTDAGCIGFSQANVPIRDTAVLFHALQYAHTYQTPVWLSPRDPSLGMNGVAHSGAMSTRLGLCGVPVMSETIALHTICELVRMTGARVHVGRLSSAAGIEIVRTAKKEGLPITCDVGIHHVHLTDMAIGFFDANARVSPPFRHQRDRDAIRVGLCDGTIDAICSDHTPVDDDEKCLPFAEASPGATGLELLLSLTLKWAEEMMEKGLMHALGKITSGPARVAGLSAAGSIARGFVADVCIVDPHAHWTVTPAALISQGKHTPFLGYELPGRVHATIAAGQVVFERSDG